MPEPTAEPTAEPDPAPTPAEAPPATVDVQTQINQALASQQAEFSRQLKEATGHDDIKSLTDAQLLAQGKLQELADNKAKESEAYKNKYEATKIENALLSAAAEAIDPALVTELLAGKAVVDADGAVSIGGKSPAEAIKQLFIDKPYLAKAQGVTGSGAPQASSQAPKDDSQLSAIDRLTAARQQ